MLLIYVSKLTNRVGYTLNLIFKSILHIPFEITLDENYFAAFEGCKLCYSDKKIGDGLYIKSVKLLYQTSIENLEIQRDTPDNPHYWNLVNIDGQWYHFDTCPHYAGHHMECFLLMMKPSLELFYSFL